MSNVRNIVQSAIPDHLRAQAQPIVENVVETLEQSLAQSLEVLEREALSMGVSAEQFDTAVVEAGLREREHVAEMTSGDSDRLDRIEATLARLVRVAEQRGLI